MDYLNDYIDPTPLKAIKDLPDEELSPLLASALDIASTSTGPWVDQDLIKEVYDRECATRGEAVALRETVNFISVWQNYKTQSNTVHTDLLPDGHPRSSNYKTRADVALYFATQVPDFDDQRVKSSIINAISSESGSVDRMFYTSIVASVAPQYMYLIDDADSVFPNDDSDSMYQIDDSYLYYLETLSEVEDESEYEDEV